MLNKLHIYERFWTCLCPSKFHNLEAGECCNDCLYELVFDIHCAFFIERIIEPINTCLCNNGCKCCRPDDYIFNEKTLEYEKK